MKLVRFLPIFFLILIQGEDVWETLTGYDSICHSLHSEEYSCTRHHPVTFSDGWTGYVGLGSHFDGYHQDFYRYAQGNWTAVEEEYPFALGYAYGVSSFGVRTHDADYKPSHAYIGFGQTTDNTYPTSFYRFNFEDETFTALAEFIGAGRKHPALVITVNDETGEDEFIYVGCGSNGDGNLKDWYQYNINSDVWLQLDDLPGEERHHPFYFSIDNQAFVGFGHGDSDPNLNILKDFYVYGPQNSSISSSSWRRLDDFPGEARVAGTQFSYAGQGYILSGDGDNHGWMPTGELWVYNPLTDHWTELASQAHPGESRWAPGCFLLTPAAEFMGSGSSSSISLTMPTPSTSQSRAPVHLYFTSGKNRLSGVWFDDLLRLELMPQDEEPAEEEDEDTTIQDSSSEEIRMNSQAARQFSYLTGAVIISLATWPL